MPRWIWNARLSSLSFSLLVCSIQCWLCTITRHFHWTYTQKAHYSQNTSNEPYTICTFKSLPLSHIASILIIPEDVNWFSTGSFSYLPAKWTGGINYLFAHLFTTTKHYRKSDILFNRISDAYSNPADGRQKWKFDIFDCFLVYQCWLLLLYHSIVIVYIVPAHHE